MYALCTGGYEKKLSTCEFRSRSLNLLVCICFCTHTCILMLCMCHRMSQIRYWINMVAWTYTSTQLESFIIPMGCNLVWFCMDIYKLQASLYSKYWSFFILSIMLLEYLCCSFVSLANCHSQTVQIFWALSLIIFDEICNEVQFIRTSNASSTW